MILENYRDKELMKLYQMLSGSDLEGNFKNGWVISMLYALQCVDCFFNESGMISKKEYVVLVKELLRISETKDNEGKNEFISLPTWAVGLYDYMKESGKRVKDIHSMNSYELMTSVKQRLEGATV